MLALKWGSFSISKFSSSNAFKPIRWSWSFKVYQKLCRTIYKRNGTLGILQVKGCKRAPWRWLTANAGVGSVPRMDFQAKLHSTLSHRLAQLVASWDRNLIVHLPDDSFLLRFLRVKKYLNSEAFKMFEKFLIVHQAYPQWFSDFGLQDLRMKELFESGYAFPLKERDQNGCRVVVIQGRKVDPKKFTANDVYKIISWVRG